MRNYGLSALRPWIRSGIVLGLFLFAGCNSSAPTASIGASGTSESSPSDDSDGLSPVRLTADNNVTISPAKILPPPQPEIMITTSLGEIRVRLYSSKAPVTVGTFLNNYVARGFYDTTIFHFVDRSSVVVGGSYTEDLKRRDPDAPIRCEAHNGLLNRRGTIAMTRDRDDAHSANSEFYFNVVDNPALDYRSRDTDADYGYCVFGEIIEGLDVLDRIANADVHSQDDFENLPNPVVVIHSIQQVQ